MVAAGRERETSQWQIYVLVKRERERERDRKEGRRWNLGEMGRVINVPSEPPSSLIKSSPAAAAAANAVTNTSVSNATLWAPRETTQRARAEF